eukprot:911939-Rhodomonas_salina.2
MGASLKELTGSARVGAGSATYVGAIGAFLTTTSAQEKIQGFFSLQTGSFGVAVPGPAFDSSAETPRFRSVTRENVMERAGDDSERGRVVRGRLGLDRVCVCVFCVEFGGGKRKQKAWPSREARGRRCEEEEEEEDRGDSDADAIAIDDSDHDGGGGGNYEDDDDEDEDDDDDDGNGGDQRHVDGRQLGPQHQPEPPVQDPPEHPGGVWRNRVQHLHGLPPRFRVAHFMLRHAGSRCAL